MSTQTGYIPVISIHAGEKKLGELAASIAMNYAPSIVKNTFDLLDFRTREEYIEWLKVWKTMYKEESVLQRERNRKLRQKKTSEEWVSDLSDSTHQWYRSSPRSRLQIERDGYRNWLHGMCKIRTQSKNLLKQIEKNK